jgi:hypothetical protein
LQRADALNSLLGFEVLLELLAVRLDEALASTRLGAAVGALPDAPAFQC